MGLNAQGTISSPALPQGGEHARIHVERLDAAIQSTQEYLLHRQNPGGWWQGVLEADASVAAGYLAVMRFMGVPVSDERKRKIVTYCRNRQRSDGAWPAFHGGPPDLNVSIQVYLGLKLAGCRADEAFMQQACRAIVQMGGIGKSSVFTKIWLALFGQFDWRWTPSVPPEIIFLPKWFYINIYEFASWSRQTIMALALVTTLRPVCRLWSEEGVEELYVEPQGKRSYPLGKLKGGLNWRNFFLIVDRLIKEYEKQPFLWRLRYRALDAVEEWITRRQEADGGWGGIMLPWIYSLFAFKALGRPMSHPVIAKGMAGLETFILEDDDELLLQPAESPVWDTAWAAVALEESGMPPDHPALQQAGAWLLTQEIRLAGDWRIKDPQVEPGGWAFEFENDWYPDLDDSAVVPRALLGMRLDAAGEAAKIPAIERSRRWVLALQSKDGGWAAFDRDNDKQALYHVPFSEFMSPLDPTCSDVTAHVIEMLSLLRSRGWDYSLAPDPADRRLTEQSAERDPMASPVQRAIAYLRQSQETDGAWYGRWGVNYLYGTGLTLAALAATGERMDQTYIRNAVSWLLSVQNADGGWGETCETYVDPSLRGCGISTASQTAWVLIGLAAALAPAAMQAVRSAARERGQDEDLRAAIHRGVEFLLRTQQVDGGWDEPEFTGGGFPKVFYLRYELYKIYFPLLALARVRELVRQTHLAM